MENNVIIWYLVLISSTKLFKEWIQWNRAGRVPEQVQALHEMLKGKWCHLVIGFQLELLEAVQE